MKVLFLSPDFPLPADSGLKVRVMSQLRLLSALEEIDRIDLFSLNHDEVATARLQALKQSLPKVRAHRPVVRTTSVRRNPKSLVRFLSRRLLHGEPYIVALNTIQQLRQLIDRHLATNECDVLYVGYLGMMSYVEPICSRAPRAAIILEQHNVEWQIFDRLAHEFAAPLRQVVQLEAQALRRYELAALRRVDRVIAISDADARHFQELAQIDAVVVPPFIVPKPARVESSVQRHIGYVGHLAWQPNVYGLDWFCRDVWPLVRARLPDARLTIAGHGLRQDASGAVQCPPEWSVPGVKTVGFVSNLEDLYAQIIGTVAPIIGGSGVRMKILETMSAGMPTVSTSDGAAGLDVQHERELLIADEPAAFADCVARIMCDAEIRARLRANAYAYLEFHHSEHAGISRLRRALPASQSL